LNVNEQNVEYYTRIVPWCRFQLSLEALEAIMQIIAGSKKAEFAGMLVYALRVFRSGGQ